MLCRTVVIVYSNPRTITAARRKPEKTQLLRRRALLTIATTAAALRKIPVIVSARGTG